MSVPVRPYVLLSVAMSLDGCIDDTSSERLLLSNDADFDRVDQVRSEVDAILVGAGTIRSDNPRLIIKSTERRAARLARGEPEYPMKVTVTRSGDLDSKLKFWHYGGKKLVFTVDSTHAALAAKLMGLANVVSLGSEVDFGALLDNLGELGVRRLMVEGGSGIHTALLSAGLADELQLAMAPIIVGEDAAPRFLQPAAYVQSPMSRMKLVDVRKIDDVALLRYFPKVVSSSYQPNDCSTHGA